MVGWRRWEGEEGLTKDHMHMMNMLTIFIVMFSQVYTCFIIYHIVYFKYIQFIVCQFYLNKAFFKGKQTDLGSPFIKRPFSGLQRCCQRLVCEIQVLYVC